MLELGLASSQRANRPKLLRGWHQEIHKSPQTALPRFLCSSIVEHKLTHSGSAIMMTWTLSSYDCCFDGLPDCIQPTCAALY